MENVRRFISFLLIWLAAAQAHAHNELHEVKLASCRPGVCTKLDTAEMFRSTLSPNIFVFGSAHMSLVDVLGKEKEMVQFDAADGYYDLQEQVIVLRNLKHSTHHELIYSLTEGKFVYF